MRRHLAPISPLVTDLERVVHELTANGVTFERYDDQLETDARGIQSRPRGKVAWFKDPDSNVVAGEH